MVDERKRGREKEREMRAEKKKSQKFNILFQRSVERNNTKLFSISFRNTFM